MSTLYGSPTLYNVATKVAHYANLIPSVLINCGLNPWAEGHEMMEFPKRPFHEMMKDIKD